MLALSFSTTKYWIYVRKKYYKEYHQNKKNNIAMERQGKQFGK